MKIWSSLIDRAKIEIEKTADMAKIELGQDADAKAGYFYPKVFTANLTSLNDDELRSLLLCIKAI